jgi:hypothetical protein
MLGGIPPYLWFFFYCYIYHPWLALLPSTTFPILIIASKMLDYITHSSPFPGPSTDPYAVLPILANRHRKQVRKYSMKQVTCRRDIAFMTRYNTIDPNLKWDGLSQDHLWTALRGANSGFGWLPIELGLNYGNVAAIEHYGTLLKLITDREKRFLLLCMGWSVNKGMNNAIKNGYWQAIFAYLKIKNELLD